MPPCSGQSRPSPSGGREDAASLDRPCARRLLTLAVGMEECSRRGSNKRIKEWNLPKQYPTRSPIFTEPTPVAVFGTYPGRHSHRAIFARILTAIHSCPGRVAGAAGPPQTADLSVSNLHRGPTQGLSSRRTWRVPED